MTRYSPSHRPRFTQWQPPPFAASSAVDQSSEKPAPKDVDLLILGAGWTSLFLIPLLKEEHPDLNWAATTRDGMCISDIGHAILFANPEQVLWIDPGRVHASIFPLLKTKNDYPLAIGRKTTRFPANMKLSTHHLLRFLFYKSRSLKPYHQATMAPFRLPSIPIPKI